MKHVNDNPNTDQFPTQDFYLASVLKSTGLQLLNITRNDNRRSTFIFNNPNQIAENTIQKHWNNELKVVSLELVEAINQLKTRIHSGV